MGTDVLRPFPGADFEVCTATLEQRAGGSLIVREVTRERRHEMLRGRLGEEHGLTPRVTLARFVDESPQGFIPTSGLSLEPVLVAGQESDFPSHSTGLRGWCGCRCNASQNVLDRAPLVEVGDVAGVVIDDQERQLRIEVRDEAVEVREGVEEWSGDEPAWSMEGRVRWERHS